MSFWKTAALVIALMLVAAAPLHAGEAPPVDGIYMEMPNHEFRYDGKQVEVIEFLSFYCGTCYAFENAIPVIKGNFPGKTRWKPVFIHWGDGTTKPAEAYLIAADAGKGGQMRKAIYRANFVEKRNISSIEVLESIAGQVGLGPDFGAKLRSGAKQKEAREALMMAKAYGVEETPTLVIAGNMMTNPHFFNHDVNAFATNVMSIIRSLVRR